MKNTQFIRTVAILMAVTFFAVGCASTPSGKWWDSRYNCAVAGAVAGAAIGVAEDSNHDGEDAVIGAVIGGTLGALLCSTAEDGDADGDGVVDSKDECPGTPFGAAVDAVGCELDSDGDGVPDSRDRCPDTPAGTPVDLFGCSPDSDGDGVPDYADQCPNTPAGAKVNEIGCHKPLVLRGVTFAHDSAELTEASKAVLAKIAMAHKQYHSSVTLMVAGHTNSLGSDEYNQQLSERRANAVRDYMISQGSPADKLVAKGYGETMPVADNSTKSGREANRRVELSVQ